MLLGSDYIYVHGERTPGECSDQSKLRCVQSLRLGSAMRRLDFSSVRHV
jgi:hypothetical protein